MKNFIVIFLASFFFLHIVSAQTCQIQIPRVEATLCDSSGFYLIYVIVEEENGNDSCLVFADGVFYGRQSYDGPLIPMGPITGNGQPVLITVIDGSDSTCMDSFLFEGILCNVAEDCRLTELSGLPTECDSLDQFYVDVTLRGNFTNDSFNIWANGVSFGLYNYQEVPIRIGPFLGDGVNPVIIYAQDQIDTLCALGYTLAPLNCDTTLQCNWDRVIIEASECDDFGDYFLDIEVTARNMSDSFLVIVNGVVQGSFSYAQQPIRIGSFPGDGHTDLNILFADGLDSLCTYFVRREAVACDSVSPCEIGKLLVEPLPCDDDGRFSAWITFTSNQEGDIDYDVFVNQRFIGSYKSGRLPQRIERLGRRMSDYQLIKVCISDKPDCCVTREFYLPCCREEQQNCRLSSPRYRIWCLESGEYFVLLDFDASTTRSDSFTIRGNGNNYGRFSYNERPILLGPFEAGSRNREFGIRDVAYDSCAVAFALDNADCDNPTNVLEIGFGTLKVISTETFVLVEGLQNLPGKLRLYQLNGKLVLEQPWEWPITTVHTSHLPKGIYVAEVIVAGKAFSVKVATGQ
jgi:hypothetical protein